MKIKPDLVILPQVKPQLKLKITLELREQLRLLECPAQELEKEILKELEENPFLEMDDSYQEKSEGDYQEFEEKFIPEQPEDYQRHNPTEDYYQLEDYEQGWFDKMYNPHLRNQDFLKYELDIEQNIPSPETSLSVESQIESHFKEDELEIAKAIFGSLDWRGYLARSHDEIINELREKGIDVNFQKFEKVRQEMMNLDPPGIGSKDWKEFFTFVVYRKTGIPPSPELMEKIEKLAEKYNKPLEIIFSRNQKGEYYTQEDLEDIITSIESEMPQELKELKPKIDRIPLYPLQEIRTANPEYIYSRTDDPPEPDIEVELNTDGSVSVRIIKPYKIRMTTLYENDNIKTLRSWLKLLKNNSQVPKVKEYIKKAKIITEGVRRRYEILLRVTKEIFSVQADFLRSGKESDIVPLKLSDLSEKCGLSVGNISRAIKNKYVRTHYGVFPLKKFLSYAVETDVGGKISKLRLLRTLQEIIRNEDKKNPFSDSQIAKIIKEKLGVDVSRRTIVKYRGKLGIGNIAERRKLYEQSHRDA